METIKLRNNEGSMLSLRIPGRAFRLAPGEIIEIPKSYLHAQEINKLLLQKSILVIEEEKREGEKWKEDTEKDQRRSRRSKQEKKET